MKVADAKARVLSMIERDLRASGAAVLVNPISPDPTDDGKFMLAGRPARVILRFSGWHPHIPQAWFASLPRMPHCNSSEYYWYVFYVPDYGTFQGEHYFICDYHQMRDWVVEFMVAHPGAYQDRRTWRAVFNRIDGVPESQAYFRWGDEELHGLTYTSRVIALDNAAVLAERADHVGPFGVGGESEAHRLLKLYIAERPQLLGLSADARASVEHPFLTGDRVDVLFGNHGPKRSVVEVEIEGEQNIRIGVHQAIKYRALAAAQDGYTLVDPTVRAYVVAYETRYPSTDALAQAYDVRLVGVDRRDVLRRVA